MKFDAWGIVMMIVAVAIGQFVGGYLVPFLGSMGGGIVGSLVVGLACYAVYTVLTGGRWGLWPAVIFSILIYVSNLLAAYIDTLMGLGGGILTIVMTGGIAALLWGWIGGRQKKAKPLKLGKL